jgi:hypothetical protein
MMERAPGASRPPRGIPYVLKPASNTTEIRLDPAKLHQEYKRRLIYAFRTRLRWVIAGYIAGSIVTVATYSGPWWVRLIAGIGVTVIVSVLALYRAVRAANGRHR